MEREAESHAEEDRKAKEAIELRNNADNLAYQVEKQLKDLGVNIDLSAPDARAQYRAAVEAAMQAASQEAASTAALRDSLRVCLSQRGLHQVRASVVPSRRRLFLCLQLVVVLLFAIFRCFSVESESHVRQPIQQPLCHGR